VLCGNVILLLQSLRTLRHQLRKRLLGCSVTLFWGLTPERRADPRNK
jgi:hypothetical protein